MSAGNGSNPARRPTKHPFRDSVLIYAAMGIVVVAFAYGTGSGFLKSLGGGLAAFVLATAWTWWRLRSRERHAEREEP